MGKPLFLLAPKSKKLLGARRPVPRNVRNAAAAVGALLVCLLISGGCTALLADNITVRDMSWEDLAILAAFIGLPSVALTLGLLYLTWRKFTGDLREAYQADLLEEHGEVLDGELLECLGHKRRVPGWWVTARYRFQTPKGDELFGENRYRRDDLKKQRLPAPGTPVAVLYLDEENFRLL